MADETTEEKPLSRPPLTPRKRSYWIPWAGCGLIVVVLIILVAAGHAVSVRRGPGLAMGWRNSRQPGYRMMARGVQGGRFAGGVAAISGTTITMRSNGTDQSVAIVATTAFYAKGAVAKQSDLQVGDPIVVDGTPDSTGVIQATAVNIR